jgi:hypothetical protein
MLGAAEKSAHKRHERVKTEQLRPKAATQHMHSGRNDGSLGGVRLTRRGWARAVKDGRLRSDRQREQVAQSNEQRRAWRDTHGMVWPDRAGRRYRTEAEQRRGWGGDSEAKDVSIPIVAESTRQRGAPRRRDDLHGLADSAPRPTQHVTGSRQKWPTA